ncbi:MAG TPA: hypothetical protein VMM13_04185 [Euzebya sp.]|nr:hypothetical protein [Euzebya sp.]
MSAPADGQRLLIVIALVIGLAGGFAATLLLGGTAGDPAPAAAAAVVDPTRDGDPEADVQLPAPDPVADPAAARDPEAALRGFLAAEAAGAWETSYGYLTDRLRDTVYTSAAAWVRAHADFPQVTAYRVDEVTTDAAAGRANARTLTGFQATIDPVLGLVAARGRTDWTLQRDAAGLWRVDTDQTRSQPLYPSADGAARTARAWVDARVGCQDTGDLEAGLVGTRALADRLCAEDQDGRVTITEVIALTDMAETATLLSEFGPEVFSWARTVTVAATSPFTLVLGPVGEEWRVVAVLNQSP